MKTFREFIFDCYLKESTSIQELIAEATRRGGPDYDYEQSFVNLYNHMVNKSDAEGKEMRELFRKAVREGDMFTVTDLIAKEVQLAQTDPNSPLYFDNLDATDAGFTGGKRTKSGEVQDKESHREAYYNKLMNQQYSLLNFVQSKSGKIQAGLGNIAEREGSTKVPLTARARKITGKEYDTSKVDVSFVDRDGNKFGVSLKDAKGAVVNSSGAEETKAYILLGMNSLLDQQVESKEITPEQRVEKELMGAELADQLALYMASTRGMSKEQQKDALAQMQEYLSSIESVVPGTMQAMSAEAITGKGKYGDASTVDALFSTGRGGEVIEDPSWLAQYIFQRGRLGKGTTKTKEGAIQRPTTISGDIKNYRDAEDKPTDSEYLRRHKEEWGLPAWEKKIAGFEPEIQDEIRRFQSTGEFDLKHLADLESADIRAKQVKELEQQEIQSQAAAQAVQTAQAQAGQAQAQAQTEVPIDPEQLQVDAAGVEADLEQAVQAKQDSEQVYADDGSRVLRQNVGTFFMNNPEKKIEFDQNRAAADAAVADAQANMGAVAQQLDQLAQAQTETQPEPVPGEQPATVAPSTEPAPSPEELAAQPGPEPTPKKQKGQQQVQQQQPSPTPEQQAAASQEQPVQQQQTPQDQQQDQPQGQEKKKNQKNPKDRLAEAKKRLGYS